MGENKMSMKKIVSTALSVVMITSLLTWMMVVDAKTLEKVYDTSVFEPSPFFDVDFDKVSLDNLGIIERQSYANETKEEIIVDPNNVNNKVLHINRPEVTSGKNTLVSIPFTETSITNGIVEIELDLYAATKGVGVGVDGDGDWSVAALAMLTDSISAYNGANGIKCSSHSVSKTGWTHVKYQINVEDKTYNLWIDNHQCATDYGFRDADKNNSVKYVTFWLVNVTNAVDMYVDNITVKKMPAMSSKLLVDDDFNRSGSVLNNFWTSIISNNTEGLSLVDRDSAANDKAVCVDLTNDSFDGVKYAFSTTGNDNNILLSVDYKIPSSGGRPFSIYFNGNGDVKSGSVVSVTINYTQIKYVSQGVTAPSPTGIALKSNINSSDWQNIKFVVYTKDNSISVFHNDEYIGVMPFRYYGDTNNLTSVSIGGGTKTTSTTEGMYFDNIKLIDTGDDSPVEIAKILQSYNFNGPSSELPAGFSGNGSLESVDETDTTQRNLKLAANSSAAQQAWFDLDNAVTSGHLDVTYKFKVNDSGNVTRRFYLYSGNTIILSATFKAGKMIMVYDEGTPAPAAAVTKVNEENTVTFHIDVDKKTYAYTLNDGAKTQYYPLRNQSNMRDGVNRGYFGIDKKSGTDANEFCVDDLVFEENNTNYGLMELSAEAPLYLDENNTIAGIDNGMIVSTVLGYLSCKTPETEIYMTDSVGVKLDSDETVETGDIVVLKKTNVNILKTYRILPKYDMKFRSLVVNGNEYFEENSIPVNGSTVVRTTLTNNTPYDATFDMCAAIIGNKLYDVKYENDVTVKAFATQGVSTDLTIPSVEEDVVLKVMLFESDGSLKPVLEYISKLSVAKPEISMGEIFTDHMVLQRNADVNIFGIAPSGSNIRVEFNGNTAEGVANTNNEFLVKLPPMGTLNDGKPLVVTVTNGTEAKSFTYEDVVVGDVFFGSGQSNMANTVNWFNTPGNSTGPNPKANLNYLENVRYYMQNRMTSTAVDNKTVWQIPTESNYGSISATLFATATALRNLGAVDADVPIGLVTCAIGGTSISKWTGSDVLLKPEYSEWHDSYWESDTDNNKARHTDLYYAMAKSITPYTFKAAVWYQGEADVLKTFYDDYAADMITQMRNNFGYDIPYVIVQLPGFMKNKKWDQFRLVQWNIQNLVNNTYIAVTNDTGYESDIHPNDKDKVGDRIARVIMGKIYNMNIPYSGPVYSSSSINGSVVTVECSFVNDGIHGGLVLENENRYEGFELSEDGTTFYDATDVTISGNTFKVSSSSVSSPKYIRYGYVDTPIKNAGTRSDNGNVYLPLAPFSEKIG